MEKLLCVHEQSLVLISNAEDAALHLALTNLAGQPCGQLHSILCAALVSDGTAHVLLLNEQKDDMIEAFEPLLGFLGRLFEIHARQVEASAPKTSISNTIKAIVRSVTIQVTRVRVFADLKHALNLEGGPIYNIYKSDDIGGRAQSPGADELPAADISHELAAPVRGLIAAGIFGIFGLAARGGESRSVAVVLILI
jgi:hypothetical protein